MDIPQQVKDLINQVIEQDEGGWVLTHDPNDPDGGWTFGGIIAEHWVEYIQANEVHLAGFISTRLMLENDIKNKAEQLWIDRGIEIYYTKFYLPLTISFNRQNILDLEFSAAINCGVKKVITWPVRKTGAYREDFCKAWMDHYIQLIKKNAEAWALYATVDRASAQSKKPATLRSEFLQGWFNRVWRYLP